MAYSKGIISIPKVTGNLVITVTTQQSTPTYTNQVRSSTDASGNVYNGVGYKDEYRLNSSYGESAASGSAVTGFIPFDKTKTLRIRGIRLTSTAMYVEFFNSGSTGPTGQYWVSARNDGVSSANNNVRFASKDPVKDANDDLVIWDGANQNSGNKWVVLTNGTELDNITYVRISGMYPISGSGADIIVTINESIG